MTAEQATPGRPAGDKATYVRDMFAGIAHRYDLLNDILSLHRHKAWRRLAVRLARVKPGDRALDVCSGTGDFAIDLYHAIGPSGTVIGSDFCEPMLRHGQDKVDRASGGRIGLMIADAQQLPYRSDTFDCVTVGFGIRNVSDVAQAFREMARVARPGGRVACLEFSQPRHWLWRPLVNGYHRVVLPNVGGMLSRREAYTYLPDSIQAFYSREELKALMERAGLIDVRITELNFGSVCIHLGTKP